MGGEGCHHQNPRQVMTLALLFWVRLNTHTVVTPVQSQTTADPKAKDIKKLIHCKKPWSSWSVLVKDSLPELQIAVSSWFSIDTKSPTHSVLYISLQACTSCTLCKFCTLCSVHGCTARLSRTEVLGQCWCGSAQLFSHPLRISDLSFTSCCCQQAGRRKQNWKDMLENLSGFNLEIACSHMCFNILQEYMNIAELPFWKIFSISTLVFSNFE